MGSVRHLVIRRLKMSLFGITFGLAITAGAVIYLDWYRWPILVLAVAVAAVMSVTTCVRAWGALRSPLLTVMELRRRSRFG